MVTVTCSEERLAALLAGQLEGEARAELDAHLLSCESCWQAVREDRAARVALAALREPAPPGLADRVALAVEVAASDSPAPVTALEVPSGSAGTSRRPRRHLLAAAAAACLAAAALAGTLAAGLGAGGGRPDSPAVAAVVAMARARSGPPVALASTHRQEHMTIGGQRVELAAFRVEGVLTIVATASSPFAMPASSHVVAGSSDRSWMTTEGGIGLYCVNGVAGRRSMLVAAAMPAVQLPAVAGRLGAMSA